MTNEEARSVLIKTKVMCVSGKVTEFEKAQRLAYQSLEENDKLKAYIARLNGELKSEREWRYNARIELLDKKAEIEQLKEDSKIIAKELVKQIREIDQLKSELKQSVKLPLDLNRGTVCYVYANSVYTVSVDNIGKVVKLRGVRQFYGNYEEAEQSLKGQVTNE